jgi:hypothetical protein
MTKNLLVGATFRDAQPDQLEWLDLQLKFLKATTSDFDHVSFVNENSRYSAHAPLPRGNMEAFKSRDTTVVGLGDTDLSYVVSPTSEQHIKSLNALLSYFKSQRHNYDYFLFLDSDAFPIREGWLPLLKEKMRSWERLLAVVVRPEVLELRWHASVLLATPDALDLLRFGLDNLPGGDLASVQELDVGIGPCQGKFRHLVFPLIRTNQFNLHPLSYGVYFDMFYHHTFGGERNIVRGHSMGKPWDSLLFGRHRYATHYIDSNYPWEKHTAELMENPSEFVGKLAGWNPTEYADI